MAAIPPPTQHTVAAIYDSYVEDNDGYEAIGISAGSLGHPCDRSLWYDFRYASEPEKLDGRKIRIFRRGDIEEDRIIADLERIGVEITERQTRVRAVGSHIRGKIDGQAIGLVEAPKTMHLLECKSSNTKNFKPLAKNGVKAAKPEHYATMQFYMSQRGLDRAVYVCVNKDTEEYHLERVYLDEEFCSKLIARAERIIRADDPPSRISEKPDYYMCGWCKHKSTCHEGAFARVTCRSCIYSTPEMGGDAHWSCAKFNKPLSLEEQKAACPAHLYLPGMVNGEQIDSDAEAEQITYRLVDGRVWVDGVIETDGATK